VRLGIERWIVGEGKVCQNLQRRTWHIPRKGEKFQLTRTGSCFVLLLDGIINLLTSGLHSVALNSVFRIGKQQDLFLCSCSFFLSPLQNSTKIYLVQKIAPMLFYYQHQSRQIWPLTMADH